MHTLNPHSGSYFANPLQPYTRSAANIFDVPISKGKGKGWGKGVGKKGTPVVPRVGSQFPAQGTPVIPPTYNIPTQSSKGSSKGGRTGPQDLIAGDHMVKMSMMMDPWASLYGDDPNYKIADEAARLSATGIRNVITSPSRGTMQGDDAISDAPPTGLMVRASPERLPIDMQEGALPSPNASDSPRISPLNTKAPLSPASPYVITTRSVDPYPTPSGSEEGDDDMVELKPDDDNVRLSPAKKLKISDMSPKALLSVTALASRTVNESSLLTQEDVEREFARVVAIPPAWLKKDKKIEKVSEAVTAPKLTQVRTAPKPTLVRPAPTLVVTSPILTKNIIDEEDELELEEDELELDDDQNEIVDAQEQELGEDEMEIDEACDELELDDDADFEDIERVVPDCPAGQDEEDEELSIDADCEDAEVLQETHVAEDEEDEFELDEY